MEKLLYIACVNLDDKCSGITRKVMSQFQVFLNYFDAYLIGYWGNDVKIIGRTEDKIIQSKCRHRRLAVINYAISYAKNSEIELIYIRRFPCNNFSIGMLKKLKTNGAKKILWEIPTYPYDFENHSLKGKIGIFIDKLFRRKLSKYIDRIVTFSNESKIFNIHTITTRNGIDVATVRPRVVADNEPNLHLIAVAVLHNWHGYDRVLYGLKEYYNTKRIRDVYFHVVGDGPCFNEYKQLVEELGLGNYVFLYGNCEKDRVDAIYDKCDIAVESLGWHRSDVKVGTSLKVREYMAKGLPIIASTQIDIFPNGWKFAYYASTDEAPINIENIIKFYDLINEKIDKYERADRIRNLAYELCDINKMMLPIVEFLNEKYT